MFPQSIEVQMNHLHAGDFWCIQENIEVPEMETRRPRKEGQKYGGSEGDARRILDLTDNSEKPLGEWNTLIVEARGRTVKVWSMAIWSTRDSTARPTADESRSRQRERRSSSGVSRLGRCRRPQNKRAAHTGQPITPR